MYKKALFALGLVAFAAACAPKQEEIIVPVAPITTEPTMGKYK